MEGENNPSPTTFRGFAHWETNPNPNPPPNPALVSLVKKKRNLPGTLGAIPIGVCYGRVSDNLPSPQKVINLYKKSKIERIRIYEPNTQVLNALRGSNLLLSLGTRNEDLPKLATSPEAAKAWVNTNIVPYKNDVHITWISVGNEVIPGSLAQHVPNAMNNLYNALVSIGLSNVKVTTTVPASVLGVSYPPSQGVFTAQVTPIMAYVLDFLTKTSSPLMINAYPYFAYASDPTHISLDFALFANHSVVIDGKLSYSSLFDAMVDAFYSAMERAGGSNVSIVVSESGWPSAGNEPYTSIANAKIYNSRLRARVLSTTNPGTPKRPHATLDTFFFAMFNEDLKPAGVEQHFGFFYPNMKPVYPFW
ncbi:glucan endo-1,3-beta-glucosidase-like [Telopea speciosissima]|uniref:glucan endo-1,3-beta-glucosidase-like n=1 Tax=Telopea speciosissima TaxID=54955 RepID=UPI001CC668EA|nr:glucan endo-1,3-beta-glucosidase-like [Telopea speciosissima]